MGLDFLDEWFLSQGKTRCPQPSPTFTSLSPQLCPKNQPTQRNLRNWDPFRLLRPIDNRFKMCKM